MVTKAENERLNRVGPGTPMGELLREFWTPAIRSEALEAGGAPQRVRLLGENFVAFRAPDGAVGFLAEGCPHRGASLALGRNEEGGLRCIFHGWKFDVAGRCVDVPSEPPERRDDFAARVTARHHPVREAGHHTEIVRNDDQRRAELRRQRLEQLEHLRLYGDVEGRGGLVGDQELRPAQ